LSSNVIFARASACSTSLEDLVGAERELDGTVIAAASRVDGGGSGLDLFPEGTERRRSCIFVLVVDGIKTLALELKNDGMEVTAAEGPKSRTKLP
jgi:hypothetical protein